MKFNPINQESQKQSKHNNYNNNKNNSINQQLEQQKDFQTDIRQNTKVQTNTLHNSNFDLNFEENQKFIEKSILKKFFSNETEDQLIKKKNGDTTTTFEQLETTEQFSAQVENSINLMHPNMSLSQTLHCGKIFARANHMGKEEWKLVIQNLEKNIEQIDKSNVSEVLWVLAKGWKQYYKEFTDIYVKLQQTVIKLSDYLKPDDLAIIAWSFSKHKQGDIKFWSEYIKKLNQKAYQMNQVDIANTCWSLAQISDQISDKWSLEQLWDQILTKVQNSIDQFLDEHCFSIIISSVAKANVGNHDFWLQMGRTFENNAFRFSNQGLAFSIWALGRKNVFEIQNWIEVQKIVIQRINQFEYEEIMALSYGFIKMEFGTKDLWDNLLEKIQEFLTLDSDQQNYKTLSTCAYVIGQLDYQSAKNQWQLLENSWINKVQKDGDIQMDHFIPILSTFSVRNKGSEQLWKCFENQTMEYIDKQNLKQSQKQIQQQEQAEKQNQNENQHKDQEIQQDKNQELNQQKSQDKEMVPPVIDFDSKIVTNIVYGFSLRNQKLVSEELKNTLYGYLQGNIQNLSLQGLLVCFGGLVKLGILSKFQVQEQKKTQILADEFIQIIHEKVDQIDVTLPPDMGMLLYSLSKLNYVSNNNINKILQVIEQKILFILEDNQILENGHLDLTEPSKIQIVRTFLGQLDLAHTVMGFQTYNAGSDKLWKIFDKIAISYLSELKEQNISILMRVGKNKFSDEFYEKTFNLIKLNHTTYSNIMIQNIINAYRNFDKADQEQFGVIEQTIQYRVDNNMINIQELTQVLSCFATTQMGSSNFWNQILNSIQGQYSQQIMKIDLKNVGQRQVFIQLLEVLAKLPVYHNRESKIFGMVLTGSKIILNQRFITIKELASLIQSFAQLKYSDQQVWFLLEKNLMKNRLYTKINSRLLLRCLETMKQMNRISYKSQKQIFDHLANSNDQNLDFDSLLKYLQRNTKLFSQYLELFYIKLRNLQDKKENQELGLKSEYFKQLHSIVYNRIESRVLGREGDLIINLMSYQEFLKFKNYFDIQIININKKDYTMQLNQIIDQLNTRQDLKQQMGNNNNNNNQQQNDDQQQQQTQNKYENDHQQKLQNQHNENISQTQKQDTPIQQQKEPLSQQNKEQNINEKKYQ